MTGLFPNCVRCDRPLDLLEGELRTVYCSRCMEAVSKERLSPELTPYTVAYCIVSDARLVVLREEGRISSPHCRKLRRVLDYLDVMCDLEAMDWPEVIEG